MGVTLPCSRGCCRHHLYGLLSGPARARDGDDPRLHRLSPDRAGLGQDRVADDLLAPDAAQLHLAPAAATGHALDYLLQLLDGDRGGEASLALLALDYQLGRQFTASHLLQGNLLL